MNATVWANLEGIASHLPARVVTNDELAPEVGWTAADILAKTGIAARHVAGADECVSDLTTVAAEKLLTAYGVDRASLDFLILCTQTPDHFLPATACIVHARLGLSTRCAAFDINQGCSGYVYALALASSLIRSGMARRGLVLTGDNYTKFIHPRDRSVRTLFGDAGTATLIGATDAPGLDPFVLGTDGKGACNLIIPAGATRRPHDDATAREETDASGNVRSAENLFMNGQQIFQFTLQRVPELFAETLQRASLTLADIDWFVLHQANAFMLDHLQQKLRLPPDKVVRFLRDTGNTVSSTIPLALEDAARRGALQAGQRVMLAGFGVGYSWGATLVRWPPNFRS